MYEHKSQPLAPRGLFYRRVFRNVLVAGLFLWICLVVGIVGYHYWAKLSWIDSLHNASMILSGMGPVVNDPQGMPYWGKVFSSLYALFSGVAFITNIGIILAPVIHRLIHRIHLE